MDPKKLFFDKRMAGFCVFCGRGPESRDHCPSRILLDEPFPTNLPVVEACEECNEGFSKDEEYLACLLECVIHGSVNAADLSRPSIKRILTNKPSLSALIESSKQVDDAGNAFWQADEERVRRIVLKLARGHIAYELSLPKLEEPQDITFVPFLTMSEHRRVAFETPSNRVVALWPEIGSRAFVRVATAATGPTQEWINIQPRRYRYLVSQSDGDFVQIVLSEYLACKVEWN